MFVNPFKILNVSITYVGHLIDDECTVREDAISLTFLHMAILYKLCCTFSSSSMSLFNKLERSIQYVGKCMFYTEMGRIVLYI